MTKIYISANWNRRNEAQEVAKYFIESGFEICSLWIEEDKESKPGVAKAVRNLFSIEQCDIFVLLSDEQISGGNKFVEFGYALALKKKVILIGGNDKNLFELLPGITKYKDIKDLNHHI